MTAQRSAILSSGACLGCLTGPIIMGLTIDDFPLALPYMIAVCIAGMIVLGVAVAFIGNGIVKVERELKEKKSVVELQDVAGGNANGTNAGEKESANTVDT